MIVISVILTLRQLRSLIHEEVERNMRWSAGFCGGLGIGGTRQGTKFHPQGLGDEGEETKTEEEYEEEQEPSQFTTRVDKRSL